MTRTTQLKSLSRWPLLLAFALMVGCSKAPDSAEQTKSPPAVAEETFGETPSIDDVLAPSYREIWAEWSGDLDGMIERRLIRVVTPYSSYMYFFEDGQPRGATWELANHLEREINTELGRRNVRVFVVVIPLARDKLIPALLAGNADIIAGDLTQTEMRSERLAFTRPLLKDINEVVVGRRGIDEITSLDALAGRTVHVREASSYFEHLQRLAADMQVRGLQPPTIERLDELLESADVLDLLNNGVIDMTVMDDYKAEFWAEIYPDIEVRNDLVVNDGGSISWVTRQDAPQLLQRLNAFLREYGRGTLVGNDTYNRYLADAEELRCVRTSLDDERLQVLSSTFEQYADLYDFDWLQIAAQAFQESKFVQSKVSGAGAVGIMQVKPTTASDRNVGIDDISTVDNNVHAGVKYMRFLADRYFSDIDPLNRWLLSLAAYNAGPARVIDLRREARENGYDPDVWFNNVEIIAARRIGRETVTYVSNIFKYYSGYSMASAKIDERLRRFGGESASCEDPATVTAQSGSS
ncbi:MAG: transporter substrate-binding domain-containing protein [Pseudomonadota bacterium]